MRAIFRKKSVTQTKEKKAISQFQALTTALATTIGTGNIAGVATAITFGGPGAVFWMWISAFFGMMTNFSENVLGIFYRKKNMHGEWSGGAMYYISEGLKEKKGIRHFAKPLAVLLLSFVSVLLLVSVILLRSIPFQKLWILPFVFRRLQLESF